MKKKGILITLVVVIKCHSLLEKISPSAWVDCLFLPFLFLLLYLFIFIYNQNGNPINQSNLLLSLKLHQTDCMFQQLSVSAFHCNWGCGCEFFESGSRTCQMLGVTPHSVLCTCTCEAFCGSLTDYNLYANCHHPGANMDDIFSRLLNLTSYLTHRLIQFFEGLVARDVSRYIEYSGVNSYVQNQTYGSCDEQSSSFLDCASTPRFCNTDIICHERDASSNLEGQSILSSGLEIVNRNCSRGIDFIFKGLMLPILSFELAWGCSSYQIMRFRHHVRRTVSRVLTSLQGSSGDIGWLQCAPGMAPVEDGSDRFRDLLQDIRNGIHKLPDSFVYLLIPGLFSNHGPLYFVSCKRFFSKMGLACHIAKIHSEASVEHNAWELKQYIEELYWGSGKRVMLLGHSKGGVDAAAALSIYSQELRDKVAGLALVQSPYGGTPIASDMLREGQVADKETRRIMEFVVCKLIKGDIRALEDLTYEKRKEFIKNHKLPENIPLISFHSEASVAPGVIATMSHIAHAELPWLPRFGRGNEAEEEAALAGRKVPVIVPVSAAMALSSLHLQLRYGEKSDGLVTCRDAEVPGSVVVKPDRKMDHSWIVFSTWKKNPAEPDASEMCEALLTMLVENGRKLEK